MVTCVRISGHNPLHPKQNEKSHEEPPAEYGAEQSAGRVVRWWYE